MSVSNEVRDEALKRARALADGLFPHQVEGLAFLLGRRRAILADDMGLGKTRQSVLALTEAAPQGPWLVITPASVKRNWEREIHAVRPNDAVHIIGPAEPPDEDWPGWVIVNYDLLGKHVELLEEFPWSGLVFDEAHYLKNHKSQRSKHSRLLVDARPDAVLHALTGTPLTNRPRDLFPLLQLVGHPMGRSFLSFAKRYCDATHNGFGWVTTGASNLEELRVQLHGVMLRRTKDEVLDLPPKLRSWVPVTVPEGTGRKEARRVLQLLLARHQQARHPERSEGSALRLLAEITRARLAVAKAKVPTTIEYVEGVVAQGEKALVFSSFEDPIDRIANAFGPAAMVIAGGTPQPMRQKIVDRFQNDDSVRVLVANIIAGGVGLNLTAARQVVFNDLDWVPANHWQAEDRAYRIGQTGTVNVTYFCAQETIDEFVALTLSRKAQLIDAVVEGSSELPSDVLADLEAAFRGLSPDVVSLKDDASGEDPVDRLLREVTAAVAAKAGESGERAGRARVTTLHSDAVLALARALSGPVTERYKATSSSNPAKFYVLDVVSGDIMCNCRGFEYRGACVHSRALKKALATGAALPEGMARME